MIRLRTGTEFLPFPKRLIGPLSALASSGPALRKYRGPRVYRLGLQSSMLLLRWSIVSPRNPVSRMLTETNIHVREHPTKCEPSVTKQNTRFVTLFFIFRIWRFRGSSLTNCCAIRQSHHLLMCVSPRDLSSLDMNPSALRAWYAPD